MFFAMLHHQAEMISPVGGSTSKRSLAGSQQELTRLWEGRLQQTQRMMHRQQIIRSSFQVVMHAVYTLCRLQVMAGHDLQPLFDIAVVAQLATACSRSCCVVYLAL
jgi:hypothetical protein